MVKRDDVIRYLAGYMAVAKIKDYGPNGLQVEGRPDVRKIVTSVSASEELFRKAALLKADMVIVHHGILWEGQSPIIKGSFRKRIAALLENSMTLLGYHLTLDRHPKIGNNFLAAKGLGLKALEYFGDYHSAPIGFQGRFPRALPAKEFFKRVDRFYGVKSLVLPYGPARVQSVGVISGGASKLVNEAVKLKLDAYVTGEACESIVQQSREEGIHFIAAGHYATERPGIQALGRHIASRFKVEVEYVDLPVPV